jgi:hypothetical protein
VKLVSRSAWGARSARGSTYLRSALGVKVHYTGSHVNPALLDDHRRCAPAVRGIQNGHMDGNDWVDLGYSAVVCGHGHVFVGRGPHVLPSANGPGRNSGHYAVCALVGNSGLTVPTLAMLHGIRDAIEWLRREGDAGNEIKGHRDGYATDCPGGPLYAWVRRGAPRPDEEDDMPTVKEFWDEPIDTGDGGKPWRARSVLGNIEKDQDKTNSELGELRARLDAQAVQLDEIIALLTPTEEPS